MTREGILAVLILWFACGLCGWVLNVRQSPLFIVFGPFEPWINIWRSKGHIETDLFTWFWLYHKKGKGENDDS